MASLRPRSWCSRSLRRLGNGEFRRSRTRASIRSGKDLADFVKRIASPDRYLVVLSPRVSAQEWREEQRMKTGYVHFSPDALDAVLQRETAQIGYWLDSSSQTSDETVEDILSNLSKAAV